jgi:hypothetical protein
MLKRLALKPDGYKTQIHTLHFESDLTALVALRAKIELDRSLGTARPGLLRYIDQYILDLNRTNALKRA